jgi:hypothetical protein
MKRLVWLCRDKNAPVGELPNRGKRTHHLFSAKPLEFRFPTSGRLGFVATTRARYLGELLLPMRGLRAMKPGTGRWIQLTIEMSNEP